VTSEGIVRRTRWGNTVLGALALATLQACAEERQTGCLLHSQKPMVVAELFFGRDAESRPSVGEAEWASFVDSVVARQFPEGFTILNGKGAWLDTFLGQTLYEPSKVLVIAASPSPSLGARLQAVADAYRRRFHQQSVGIVTTQACGAF
jgi:hypothetical protein